MTRKRLAAMAIITLTALALPIACSSSKLATSNPTTTPSDSNDASPAAIATATPSIDAAPQDGGPPAAACATVAVTVCPDAGVPTYTDVAPIFQARCASCHKGEDGGPWPLDDYEPIADWQGEVRAMILNCSMPPADSGVTMPDDETAKLLTWIKCGLPK